MEIRRSNFERRRIAFDASAAQFLIKAKDSGVEPEALAEGIAIELEHCLRRGVTGIHDIIVSKEEYDSWHETVEILRDARFVREIREGVRRLARTRKRHTIDELFRD